MGWMSSPSSTPSPSPTITPTLFHPFSSLILLNAATRFGGEEFVRLPAKKTSLLQKLQGTKYTWVTTVSKVGRVRVPWVP